MTMTDRPRRPRRRSSTTRSPRCRTTRTAGISNPVLGMLLFITSEVMFFGGLFAAYFSIRANAAQWPPINPETRRSRSSSAILPFV